MASRESSPLLISYLPQLTAVVLTLYAAYHLLVYPFFLSPLRHIPRAHWSVPIPYLGALWILYQRSQSRNNATTYAAHLAHGPVVRLGPEEVSVNCYEGGLKTVYAGGYEKHEWYPRQFANFGVMNMFSTVGHTAHAAKKRIMANIYSKSFLANSPHVRENSTALLRDRILPLLGRIAVPPSQGTASNSSGRGGHGDHDPAVDAGAGTVDFYELSNAFTMDFMTAYQFGIVNSTDFTRNPEVRRKYLHLYHSRRDWQFISSEVPPAARRLLQAFGVSLYPQWIHDANAWLENWSRNMCDAADRYLKRLNAGSVTDDKDEAISAGNEPLVFKQYRTGLFNIRSKDPMAGVEVHPHLDEGMNFSGLKADRAAVPDDHTTLLEVYSDMVDQLAAGHETSALALTYLFYELAQRPDMQDRLHDEVSTLQPDLKWSASGASTSTPEVFELPSCKDIDALPYLNALILETLRLHAPIPGMQPRITPSTPGGISLGPPGTKHQYTNLPGNIRVSAMAYTLHRIPSVFPSPELFQPTRWLPASAEAGGSTDAQLTEMNRHFWAFGSGGRMCIGRHFALQEIKLLVAAVFRNWRTELVDADGIEEVDAYTTHPRSGKLILKFTARH